MTLSRAVHHVTSRDHRVMRRMHQWHAPRWVRWWMIASTRGGDGWFWIACGLAVLASQDPARHAAVAAASLASAVGIVLFRTIKKTVGRQRPCHIEPHCWATLLPPDQFSFPSGHTITAFAMAVSLGLFYPALLPGLLFCAVSVAASRVVLGMHFLSDVLAGALLGVLLGYGACWVVS